MSTEAVIEQIRSYVASDDQLNRMASYTLADAIREGSQFTNQTEGWGKGEQACALTAAYYSAKARGYVS